MNKSRKLVLIVVLLKPPFGEVGQLVPRYFYFFFNFNRFFYLWSLIPVWIFMWFFFSFLQSLCNACGIKSRKKRRAILDKKSKNPKNLGNNLKQRLISLGRKVLMQKSTIANQIRKLGEEEQAALLLMALSYGSVYA